MDTTTNLIGGAKEVNIRHTPVGVDTTGCGMGAKYPMYPTSTNTPAWRLVTGVSEA